MLVRGAVVCRYEAISFMRAFAGTGSNLTYNGFVECDASIMDGESQSFGSVGALKGHFSVSFNSFSLNFF